METSSRHETKAELLRSAERLIAEKGLGSVSVKMITLDAGARNPSAVHYHFGSIETLIKEVFAKRYREIEVERSSRLAKVNERNPKRRLVALMEAAIGPYMEVCLEEGGRLYANFCLQFSTDPRFDYALLIAETGPQSLVHLRAQLIACLPGVPAQTLASRLRHSFMISLIQTADYARKVEAGTAPQIDAAVSEAASCLAAYLSAPS